MLSMTSLEPPSQPPADRQRVTANASVLESWKPRTKSYSSQYKWLWAQGLELFNQSPALAGQSAFCGPCKCARNIAWSLRPLGRDRRQIGTLGDQIWIRSLPGFTNLISFVLFEKCPCLWKACQACQKKMWQVNSKASCKCEWGVFTLEGRHCDSVITVPTVTAMLMFLHNLI